MIGKGRKMKWTVLLLTLVAGAFGQDPTTTPTTTTSTAAASGNDPVCTAVNPGENTPPDLTAILSFYTYAQLKMTDGAGVIRYTEMEIYFDFPNKQGAVITTTVSTTAGQTDTTRKLYDFSQNFLFTVTDACTISQLPADTPVTFFDFTITLDPQDPVYSAASVFYFGGVSVPEELVATDDGEQHWKSCLTTPDGTTIKLDYYFRNDMPVKAEMKRKGSDNSEETFEYTFFGFRKRRPSDDTVFEVPRDAVGCTADAGLNIPTAPSLPSHFSLTTEVTYQNTPVSYVIKEFHDNDMKLSRYDWNPTDTMTSQSNYPNMPIVIIHNFHDFSKLEYIIKSTGECSVSPIRAEILEGEWNDVTLDNGTLVMRRGSEFFDMNPNSLQYQGSKKLRSLDTDVWVETNGEKTLAYHFTKNNWQTISTGGAQDQQNPLAGIWIKQTNEDGVAETIISHVVNYIDYRTQQPNYSPFDINSCVSEQKHFRVQVQGNYVELVYGDRRAYLDPVVRTIMAQQAIVSPLRITDIEYYKSSESIVDIWMTLLGVPELTPSDSEYPSQMTELGAAYGHIQQSVESGITFIVTYPSADTQASPTEINVLKDSLRTNAEEDDPRGSTIVKQGHSNGSMAALGIFMILLGAVVGIGVGFFLWRRRGGRGIPYAVQH